MWRRKTLNILRPQKILSKELEICNFEDVINTIQEDDEIKELKFTNEEHINIDIGDIDFSECKFEILM